MTETAILRYHLRAIGRKAGFARDHVARKCARLQNSGVHHSYAGNAYLSPEAKKVEKRTPPRPRFLVTRKPAGISWCREIVAASLARSAHVPAKRDAGAQSGMHSGSRFGGGGRVKCNVSRMRQDWR